METRKLDRGELTTIVIATVMNQDQPVNARQVTEMLNSWGIAITIHQMSVRLSELGNQGRIHRVSRGLYEGC